MKKEKFYFFACCAFRYGISPPASSSSCMKAGMGLTGSVLPVVRLRTSFLAKSTSNSSPCFAFFAMPWHSMSGRPMLKPLR